MPKLGAEVEDGVLEVPELEVPAANEGEAIAIPATAIRPAPAAAILLTAFLSMCVPFIQGQGQTMD
jgi:hypothetical protein